MKVRSIRQIQYEGDVYNLHIQDNHNYFANGNCVANCHLFAATELTNIMTKLTNARFRHGTTGTLKDSKVNSMVLEGLFGKVYQTTTTRQMIDDGKAAQLDINILQLQYTQEERKAAKKKTYVEEMEFLQAHEGRNRFIRNLVLSLKGNILVLYEKVEKHGQIIHDMIASEIHQDRKLFFVFGDVKPDERNEIRYIAEEETDAIIVASYGTYSTGVNIRNIDHVISVAPGKSKIRLFQSIGRGLRLSSRKTRLRWYDIADDLTYKEHFNYSTHHLLERIGYYNQEAFDYKQYKIEISQ
jgi:superfamily II DNA or RNA helicase